MIVMLVLSCTLLAGDVVSPVDESSVHQTGRAQRAEEAGVVPEPPIKRDESSSSGL